MQWSEYILQKQKLKASFSPSVSLEWILHCFIIQWSFFIKKIQATGGFAAINSSSQKCKKNSLLKAGTILLISLHKECFCWVTKIQDKTISKIFISCQEFSQKNFFLNFHCCYEARNYPVGTLNCFHNLSKSHFNTAENKHKIIASFVNFTSLYTDFSLWNTEILYACKKLMIY